MAVADDTLPDGTRVRAGEVVCWCSYNMGRMTQLWGADAAEFRPERFLGVARPSPFLFPAFNAGPRTCLGQGMALLEASLVLGVIYRRFGVAALPGQTVTYKESLTLPQAEGVRMVISARQR